MSAPAAPTITSITQTGVNTANVYFTPGSDGGSAITHTLYSINGQTFVSTNDTSSPVSVPGLSPGQSFSIRLQSQNGVGISSASGAYDISMVYYFDMRNAMSIDTDGNQFVVALRKELSGENKYFVSHDGVHWETRLYPSDVFATASPYVVKWTGNQFILAGDFEKANGTHSILLSNDAAQFSVMNTNLPGKIMDLDVSKEKPHTITFPSDMTLCFGSGPTYSIAYSHNSGISWTGSIGSSAILSTVRAILWTGNQWIAAGEGSNTIATSTDNGKTWVGRGSYIHSTAARDIAYGKEIVVSVGQGNNSTAFSYDGVYWTGLGVSFFSDGRSVAFNGDFFLAVGFDASGNVICIKSADGKNWSIVAGVPFVSSTLLKIEWSGEYWTVFADSHHYTSNHGTVWTTINSAGSPSNVFNGTYYLQTNGTQLRRSVNDSTWNAYSSVLDLSNIYGVAWNHSDKGSAHIFPITVAVGYGSNTIAYSVDGIAWTGLGKSIFSTNANACVWNGEYWCAVGAGTHTIAVSRDGIHWRGGSLSGDLFVEA